MLDVFEGHIEKVRGDGGLASGEDGSGSLDAGLDDIGVPGGILRYCTVDNLGLGGVGKRSQVADARLGRFADLDR
jgi:hypothetical protein